MRSDAVFHTVYMSTPVTPFGSAELDDLLMQARRKNRAAGLTGLLLFAETRFLQVLEGEETAVRATFARIERDRRHKWVRPLVARTTAARQFADWSMAYEQPGAGSLTVRLEAALADAGPGVRRAFTEFTGRVAA
ncbi:MAG: BLUF domain-containing protein [Pseudomonadota bacterium]